MVYCGVNPVLSERNPIPTGLFDPSYVKVLNEQELAK